MGSVRDCPPTNWLTRRPCSKRYRSARSSSRPCSRSIKGSQAVSVPDQNNRVAASPQTEPGAAAPAELGHMIMEFVATDETAGQSAGPHQRATRVATNPRQQPAPRSDSTPSSPLAPELQALDHKPDADDAMIQHELHELQSRIQSLQTQLQIIKEENLSDYAARDPYVPEPRHFGRHFQPPNHITNEVLAADEGQAGVGVRRGRKPSSNILGAFLLVKKDSYKMDYEVPENYTRPPHPYDTGKVCKANLCPVCEKYTVAELERPVNSDSRDEALRARFSCGRCQDVFDLGITPFDPRGTPGVTLHEGEDRFRPPVPPPGAYPCPRCWKNTHTSFHGMAVYLREDSRVRCAPACPAERVTDVSSALPAVTTKKNKKTSRKAIRTVIGRSS